MRIISVLGFVTFTVFAHAAELPTLVPPVADEDDGGRELEIYKGFYSNRFVLAPHLGTYLLPLSYNARAHNDIYSGVERVEDNRSNFYKKNEAEFQISFSLPVYRGFIAPEWDLMFAYTHHSYWQIYNSAWSRPFRETNYQPEFFARRIVTYRARRLGLSLRALDLGYVHQSNGQIQLISRSWDRVFARGVLRGKGRVLVMNLWARIPEVERGDDNPWIYAYRGFGDVTYSQKIGAATLSATVPLQFAYYSVALKWTYPWRDNLRWMISYDEGYGHSMIEMDKPVTRIAVGVTLENLIDQ